MDYIEFKKALQAIGEGHKAAEYFRITQSIIEKIKEFLVDPNESQNPYVSQYYLRQKFYFEIDEKFDKIRIQPKKIRPILCKEVLEFSILYEFNKELFFFSYLPEDELDFIKVELAKIENQANQEPATTATDQEPGKTIPHKKIPDLPQIFKSRDYFDFVISRLKNDEFIEPNRTTGRYKWLKSKGILAGLAVVLEKNNRLQNLVNFPEFEINTIKKQDLGRVFCKYFENIDFSEPIDKAFQSNSITGTHRKNFFWIKEV